MDVSLSVNGYVCGDRLPFPDFAAAVRRAGMESVGVTRDALDALGVESLRRCLRDNGLRVSSLNSAGYFTASAPAPDLRGLSNFDMVDAAAALEAGALCVICGGAGDPPMPLPEARARIEAGFGELAERARSKGVTLGLEPVHPADILAKGCVNSIAQALALVDPYPNAALILDVYHSWWDADFLPLCRRAPDKIALVQLCNLRPGPPAGRDDLASGALDMTRFVGDLLATGFRGPFELELFPRDLRGRDPLSLIAGFPAAFSRCLPT